MKLAISNIAWDEKYDERVYGYLQKAEFTGIEIAPTRIFPEKPYEHLEEAKAYAEQIKKEYGLEIVSMQSVWYGLEESVFGKEESRKACAAYWTEAAAFAQAAGCPNMVFGNPRQRSVPAKDDGVWFLRPDEVAKIEEEFFGSISEITKEHHSCVGMEANPPMYHTNYMNRTEQVLGLVDRLHHPAFRLNLDIGTMICNGETFEELIEPYGGEAFFQKVSHIHLSEPGLALVQKRDIHKELAVLLRKYPYEGYVSVEMGKREELQEIFETVSYVKRIFG